MDLVEALRIAFVVMGGAVACTLAFAPAVACRRYARAVVDGRVRTAGFWGFLAAGPGSSSKPTVKS
jgi:hypothetical protein